MLGIWTCPFGAISVESELTRLPPYQVWKIQNTDMADQLEEQRYLGCSDMTLHDVTVARGQARARDGSHPILNQRLMGLNDGDKVGNPAG